MPGFIPTRRNRYHPPAIYTLCADENAGGEEPLLAQLASGLAVSEVNRIGERLGVALDSAFGPVNRW